MTTTERVAAAWAMGRSAYANHTSTDGKSVWSYSLIIGSTTPDGRKIAYCGHYSQTTAVASGEIRLWADEIDETECTRPEHHPSDRHHWKRPVISLERCKADYFRKPTALLRAHPDASCAFVCLFCDGWHPNFSWHPEARESGREHHNDQHEDGLGTHRLSPISPSTDAQFQRMGFADEADYRALTADSKLTYGDDMVGLSAFDKWLLLDQTKEGLLATFPAILEPQPTERLWFVRPYNGRTWHRCLAPNPRPWSGPSKDAAPALCSDPNGPRWVDYRVEPPIKGRTCGSCAEKAAVHYLGTYETDVFFIAPGNPTEELDHV